MGIRRLHRHLATCDYCTNARKFWHTSKDPFNAEALDALNELDKVSSGENWRIVRYQNPYHDPDERCYPGETFRNCLICSDFCQKQKSRETDELRVKVLATRAGKK